MKKSSEPWWFDAGVRAALGPTPSRRDVIRVGRDMAALLLLGSYAGCTGSRVPTFQAYPFGLGVASGDPSQDGIVLWTRLTDDVVNNASGEPVPVRWEVSEDDSFTTIVATGSTDARPELGYSIHQEVGGLRSGRDYWYRFMLGDAESILGRARTTPAPGEAVDGLRFSFASCQNYEHGWFTAFRHMAEESPDLILHLGDYIYEGRFGDTPIVREQRPGEVTTLSEYRDLYATYRADPDLQRAHAAAPWIVTFDDHEVDNNWAAEYAEDDQSSAELLLRRAAAFQAYYEFMPLRSLSFPEGPNMRLYRELAYGSLARFFVLDTRQYRSDQACGDGRKPRCEGAFDPEATLLGPDQEAWLFDRLGGSDATWNVMANQVMISALQQTLREETVYAMDRWDGYVAAQNRLLDFLAEARPANPTVLTGDIHTNWVADIKHRFEDPASATIGAEFVGTSITSGGDGFDVGDALTRVQARNPHFHHVDAYRGYVSVDVGPSTLQADYRRVPFVSRPDAPVETSVSFVVEDGVPGVQAA